MDQPKNAKEKSLGRASLSKLKIIDLTFSYFPSYFILISYFRLRIRV